MRGVLSRHIRTLQRRAGYRGLFLACFGFYDLLVGTDVIITRRISAVFFGGTYLLAITSLLVGTILLTGIFVRRDAWYYAVAMAFKIFWAIEFFWLSFTYPILVINGILWSILALVVFVVSSWPEPVRLPPT